LTSGNPKENMRKIIQSLEWKLKKEFF
jgi:hypothetical protein